MSSNYLTFRPEDFDRGVFVIGEIPKKLLPEGKDIQTYWREQIAEDAVGEHYSVFESSLAELLYSSSKKRLTNTSELTHILGNREVSKRDISVLFIEVDRVKNEQLLVNLISEARPLKLSIVLFTAKPSLVSDFLLKAIFGNIAAIVVGQLDEEEKQWLMESDYLGRETDQMLHREPDTCSLWIRLKGVEDIRA